MKNSLFAAAVLLSGLMLVGCGDTDETMTTPTVEVTEEIMIDTTTPEAEEEMEEESMDDMTLDTTVTTEVEVLE